jgi:DHA1 family multidrug resistance protein-like MFS transporter
MNLTGQIRVRHDEPWKRNLWILWFGVILTNASYTMVVPFLPLYLLQLGVGEDTIKIWSGVIFSSAFFVGAIMAPYWGARADRSGKRRMIIRAGISLAVVYLLSAIVQNPWALLGVRMLQGFVSGFVPASMAIVATTTPKDQMGFSLGLMQTAGATGGILGPLFGGALSHFLGMRLAFVASAVVILVATVSVWLFVYEKKPENSKQSSRILEDLRVAWDNRIVFQMLLILFIVQIINLILQPLITLYVAELQGDLEGAVLSSGILFSLTGVAGILAAPIWGRLGQEKGYIKILFITLLGSGIIYLFQIMVGKLWQFGLVQFLFGLFLAGVIPAIQALVVDHTAEDFRGRAFGLTQCANQLGAMVGPLLGGVISSFAGIRSVFVMTGVCLLFTAYYVQRIRVPSKSFSSMD